MPLMTWSNELSVGIESINEQHKKLIEMLNELFKVMQESGNSKKLKKILSDLQDYTKYHFSHEEVLMQKYNYPDYDKHKAGHDGFVKKVGEFTEKFNSGEETLTIELLQFLSDWIENHIKEIDSQYSELFISRNVD